MKWQRSAHSGKALFVSALPILVSAAVLAPTGAHATALTFTAMLDAAQVVAGGGSTSTAIGDATIVFDTSARTITTHLEWVGLTGPTDRSHLHDAPPGQLSSDIFFHEVMFNVNSASNSGSPSEDCFAGLDACRAEDGFVDDVFQMPAPGDLNCPVYDNCDFADLVNRAQNHGLYIDIHTETYPGGEIRGELVAVPEPSSTWLLLGSGLAGLAYWRRKRHKRAPIRLCDVS